jgi:hypothetical protein
MAWCVIKDNFTISFTIADEDDMLSLCQERPYPGRNKNLSFNHYTTLFVSGGQNKRRYYMRWSLLEVHIWISSTTYK